MVPCLAIFLTLATVLSGTPLQAAEKIVIAHRGASGYLPEHSLAAKAAAHAMGADYIEQDLVMTRDDRLVVLHDLYLDHVTDVGRVFPDRGRGDGHFYAIDFTLAEIRQLSMTERVAIRDGRLAPTFPGRFPPGKSAFRVSTFEEEIELIQGLNRSTGREAGLYPEIKAPAFHRQAGRDISRAVLAVLKAYGYTGRGHRIFLQCFDARELQRLRRDLLPEFGMDLRLVQLIGERGWQWSPAATGRRSPAGALAAIAAYAEGIGPAMALIVDPAATRERLQFSDLVTEARAAGLLVHPYTFRADEAHLPSYADDFEDLLDIFLFKADVDGVFTDFPDRAAALLRHRSPGKAATPDRAGQRTLAALREESR
jgi:glycerophosphoryl diester phosphodiesterase